MTPQKTIHTCPSCGCETTTYSVSPTEEQTTQTDARKFRDVLSRLFNETVRLAEFITAIKDGDVKRVTRLTEQFELRGKQFFAELAGEVKSILSEQV